MKELKSTASSTNSRMASIEEHLKTMGEDTKEYAAINGSISNLENKVDILTDKTIKLTDIMAKLSKDISDQGTRTSNISTTKASNPLSQNDGPKDTATHGRKEEVENNLNNLLSQNGGCMSLDNVKDRYREQFGYNIPSELYGHSLKDWLQTFDFLSLMQPHSMEHGKSFQWFVILSERSRIARKESFHIKLIEALPPCLKTFDGILSTTKEAFFSYFLVRVARTAFLIFDSIAIAESRKDDD